MISENNGEWYFTVGDCLQYIPHIFQRRLAIDNISRKNHQVRFLVIQHLVHTLKSDVRTRVLPFHMQVRKLYNLKLLIRIKLQPRFLGKSQRTQAGGQ